MNYFPDAYFHVLLKKLEFLYNFSFKNEFFQAKNFRLRFFEKFLIQNWLYLN